MCIKVRSFIFVENLNMEQLHLIDLKKTCAKVDYVQRLIDFVHNRYAMYGYGCKDKTIRDKLLDLIAIKYSTVDGYELFSNNQMNRYNYIHLLYAHRLSCYGDSMYDKFKPITGVKINEI